MCLPSILPWYNLIAVILSSHTVLTITSYMRMCDFVGQLPGANVRF